MEDPNPKKIDLTQLLRKYSDSVGFYMSLREDATEQETEAEAEVAKEFLKTIWEAYECFSRHKDQMLAEKNLRVCELFIEIMMSLADGCQYTEDYQKQRKFVQEALEIGKIIYEPTEFDLARLYEVLSTICEEQKEIEAAKIYGLEAYKILFWHPEFGSEHKKTNIIRENLEKWEMDFNRVDMEIAASFSLFQNPQLREKVDPQLEAALKLSILIQDQRRSPGQSGTKRF